MYRYSVRYLIAAAILTDTHIIATRAGRMIAYAFRLRHSADQTDCVDQANNSDCDDWTNYAWIGTITSFLLNVIACMCVTVCRSNPGF